MLALIQQQSLHSLVSPSKKTFSDPSPKEPWSWHSNTKTLYEKLSVQYNTLNINKKNVRIDE